MELADMVRRLREYTDCVYVLVKDQLLQRLIGLVALVDFLEMLAPLGPEIAHRLDDAVRMFVPRECGAESPADNADPDLLVRVHGCLLPFLCASDARRESHPRDRHAASAQELSSRCAFRRQLVPPIWAWHYILPRRNGSRKLEG